MAIKARDADGVKQMIGTIDNLQDSGLKVVATPNTIRIVVAQTVAATAHAANDAVGGKISFAGAARIDGGGGLIQTAILRDKAGQNAIYDLFFFRADPSMATITDDAAFAFSTDLSKCIGCVPLSGIAAGGTPGIITANGVGMSFALGSGTTLYAALVLRSAATFASTSDVELEIVIIPDA